MIFLWSNIICVINSRRMKRARHIAQIGRSKICKKVLVRTLEGIILLLKYGLDKRRINIAINGSGEQARVEGGVDRIHLAQE